MKILKYLPYATACMAALLLAACSKMDATYYDFVKNGPVIYTGKADSLKAFGGKGRVKLQWVLTTDQTITGCKVYWNEGEDSLDVAVKRNLGADTLQVYITDLPEGSYNFVVYSYDKNGNRSVGSEVIGNSYGAIFASSLTIKPARSVTKSAALSQLTAIWVGRETHCVGTMWAYTGKDQQARTQVMPLADSTIITSCDVTKPFLYRTLYTPEQNAIDTFYTDAKTL